MNRQQPLTSSPLPAYNNWRGEATIFYPPPFSFQQVPMRFLPLKADFLALSTFCDNYLNLCPEFVFFRPAIPFVILVVVNYGKMSTEAGNVGWTSQNELFFSVPLNWYEVKDGHRVYKGPAQVAPFIYVDNFASQAGGREVFGWPKVQGWFTNPRVNPWAEHPRNRRSLVGLSTVIRERLYAGERPTARQLLRIEQDPPFSVTVTPPESDGPLNPIATLNRAVTGWSSVLMKAVSMVTAPAIGGYSPVDRQGLPDLVSSALGSMNVFTENLQANTINLKQFRDARNPMEVCYQALTNARMEMTQFRRAGMLGDISLLRGDPSGGLSVKVSRYADQPVVETLGLEVAAETNEGGARVATLKPVLPFWQEVDLNYVAAETICWRSKDRHWHRGEVAIAPPTSPSSRPDSHRYNTTGSAGFQVASGPFRFPKATVRVLPLIADPKRLDTICRAALNTTDDEVGSSAPHFEPFGRYVYMTVTTCDDISSETNNVGLWTERWIDFAIPVRCFKNGELTGVALFSPFMFSRSSSETTVAREVNGWPSVDADIQSPPNPWLDNRGMYGATQPLMRVTTNVWPALGVGQKTEERTLIEVVDGDVIGWQANRDWNEVAETWGKEVKTDLESMATRQQGQPDQLLNLRALGIEMLGNRAPINQISLKQFRDASEPTRACYQALVRCPTVIERVHDIQEIESKIRVKIHRYPTQPIVKTLGLVVQSSDVTGMAPVDILQPSRPFYMVVDLRSEAGENLAWRAGSRHWETEPVGKEETANLEYFQRKDLTGVGRDLVRFLDSGDTALPDSHNPFLPHDRNPQRIGDKRERWDTAAKHAAAKPGEQDLHLSRRDAREAVLSRVEPQMAIHAMLSREWENWGNPRWYKKEQARQESINKIEREKKFEIKEVKDDKALPERWAKDLRVGKITREKDQEKDDAVSRVDATLNQLPLFVVRRDSAGTAKDRLFPREGQVQDVGDDADYWSPGTSAAAPEPEETS